MAALPTAASGSVDSETIERADTLVEVVVTAREARAATSASVIDTVAMRHLQPSSFSDLLELLPGNVAADPRMGEVNSIALRQAAGITATDDYSTSALGTSFVIDGVPVNTGSELQSTTDSSRGNRVSVGKGVDMRAISTDDIAKVEIVRGIPSVEYGELTSGLVNVTRRRGVSNLEARFKADTQSQLFYLGKGVALPGKDWTVNIGVGYLDSKIDPRDRRENFKRVTASVRDAKRWGGQSLIVDWTSNLDFSATFERDDDDPDLTVNNTIDEYDNRKLQLSWNNVVKINAATAGVFRGATLTTGISYGDELLKQRKHVAPSRVMPMPVSTTPGSHYVGYLPMLYLADYKVDGKPLTAFAKASADLRLSSGKVINDLKAGAEWSMNKNFGDGAVYDLERPLTAGTTNRPRAFRDIPAMHQFSAYAEDNCRLIAGYHTFNIVAGVRATTLLNLDKSYVLHGKIYLDPRVNARWTSRSLYIGEKLLTTELGGGFGWHTKMPVAAYLYPEKIYTDIVQLNYYHPNADYRAMNVATFVDNMTNHGLRAARNFKWEVRADLAFMDNRLTLTYFREKMTDGFRYSGVVKRYVYNRYDASGFDPAAAGGAPLVDELPFTVASSQLVRTMVTNGSATRKEGVEFTFQSRRVKALATRLTISGAYFKTVNRNSQALWYQPTIIVNNSQLQCVGLYDDVDGARYESFNTNFMLDTDISRFGPRFSVAVQNMWFTSRQTLRRDGVPVGYLDADGDYHDYGALESADPVLSQLIRKFSDSAFEKLTVPLSTMVNLKATKTLWRDRLNIALYVNRLLAIEPDYQRYGVTIRRTSTPYFGMELNIKI